MVVVWENYGSSAQDFFRELDYECNFLTHRNSQGVSTLPETNISP